MQHFLLIYDHKSEEMQDQHVFADKECDDAVAAYQAAEDQYGTDPNIEIVLIGADSLATVARTHGHYFRSEDRLARFMPSPA